MRHRSFADGISDPNQISLSFAHVLHEKTIEVLRFNCAIEVHNLDVSVNTSGLAERLAHRLVASLRLPGEVLQDNKVVAEYPASLWDHIKKVLGFKHELVRVRCSETVVFPDIQLPPRQHCVSVCWHENVEKSQQ